MERIKDEVAVRNGEDDLNNFNDRERASWTQSLRKKSLGVVERLLR